MNLMSDDVDCLLRFCRAIMFTCSATDAVLFIYGRYHRRIIVIGILKDESDSSDRAITCTAEATDSLCVCYTAVKFYNGVTYLCG